MKREQVFVRAKDPTGKWGPTDVLDLDAPSFRAFVLDVLFRAGLVVGISDDCCDGESIEYTASSVED